MARFGAELSFRKLMASLLDLIDDHTEYFKGHLESLPAQERRVYLALAALWKPATTREISDQARIDTSKCSAQLTRLVERGAVQTAGGSARRKQYYLTERLYNIYYLLRRSRSSDRLVEALIRFMESYYSPSEPEDICSRIVRAAESSVGSTKLNPGLAFVRSTQPSERTGNCAELPEAHRSVSAEGRVRSHLIRAKAALACENRSGCERDVEAGLVLLPEISSLPKAVLDELASLQRRIGTGANVRTDQGVASGRPSVAANDGAGAGTWT